MVAPSPRKTQWSPNSEASGDNLPSLRLKPFWAGAVFKKRVDARGFSLVPDLDQHITFKDLKAVKCVIKSFIPELKGIRLLLNEDNQREIGVLTNLTSTSPDMMCELRKLFLLNDEFDIKIKTTCIRIATNIWTSA